MSADGKWDVTMNSPMGAQQATLTLATSGSTLTGTVEYDSHPPEMRRGKYRWNQALNASTTDGTKSLPPVVHRQSKEERVSDQ